MSVQRGLDLNLWRNTATYNSPSWNNIPNVKDVAVNRTMGEGDASSRLNDIKMMEPCLQEASLTFAMVDDPDDTDLDAIKTAFLARSMIEFAFTNSDGDGFRYEMKVFELSEPQPLDGVNVVNITVKPCYSTNAQGTAVNIP